MKLVKDEAGRANPRMSCTSGNKYARDLIEGELEALGVTPLGENGGFTQTVPNTAGLPGCESGMANIIGFVKGRTTPDEYVVVIAHHDGPHNEGQFEDEIGDQNTDNAYDDASGVAAALSMAKDFMASPPDKSVILFFSDGEEGFGNVGANESVAQRVCDATQPLWDKVGQICRFPSGGLNNFPVGTYAFSLNPTFDLSKVSVVIGLDPLGAPGVVGSDMMAVIGTERFAGLRQQVDSALGGSPAVHPAYITRNSVAQNYGDIDPFVKIGVPAMWIAQPGFQNYHGGLEAQSIQQLVQFLGLGDLPMYWALDRICSMDLSALEKVTATLTGMVRGLASGIGPRAQATEMGNYTVQDAMDAVANYAFAATGLAKVTATTDISAEASQALEAVIANLHSRAKMCVAGAGSAADPSQPLQDCQAPTDSIAVATSVIMAVDFFSTRLGPQGEVDVEPKLPIKCRCPPRRR
mmetsp:Transcript_142677/g.455396  ORF Transcript_142677/g.455396 Transcript_142677/m.455396 type:complete len:466 (-) Transcript_142677:60-1457(-)